MYLYKCKYAHTYDPLYMSMRCSQSRSVHISCVTVDCWDGDEDDPVIYHGHTLTSKIMFKDAIQAIKDHAFAVSDYPVILSIENHCSIKQQHKMAEYMQSICGGMYVCGVVMMVVSGRRLWAGGTCEMGVE